MPPVIVDRLKPALALVQSVQERLLRKPGQKPTKAMLKLPRQESDPPEDAALSPELQHDRLGLVGQAYREAMTLDDNEERQSHRFFVI